MGDSPDDNETPTSIIHLDTVVQAAYLPIFGPEHVSKTLSFTDTLDTFPRFYVNKHIDHHVFDITFEYTFLMCLTTWHAYYVLHPFIQES